MAFAKSLLVLLLIPILGFGLSQWVLGDVNADLRAGGADRGGERIPPRPCIWSVQTDRGCFLLVAGAIGEAVGRRVGFSVCGPRSRRGYEWHAAAGCHHQAHLASS